MALVSSDGHLSYLVLDVVALPQTDPVKQFKHSSSLKEQMAVVALKAFVQLQVVHSCAHF